jgi:hypothetical protein
MIRIIRLLEVTVSDIKVGEAWATCTTRVMYTFYRHQSFRDVYKPECQPSTAQLARHHIWLICLHTDKKYKIMIWKQILLKMYDEYH